jgi:mannose-binding lectin 2
MLLRFCSVLSIVVIISSFLLGLVHAAGDVQTRIGNETIERVSVYHFLRRSSGFGIEIRSMYFSLALNFYFLVLRPGLKRFLLQTVQLRTHSLYAPYIDQDLHNRHALYMDCTFIMADTVDGRWWDFGADSYVVRYPKPS